MSKKVNGLPGICKGCNEEKIIFMSGMCAECYRKRDNVKKSQEKYENSEKRKQRKKEYMKEYHEKHKDEINERLAKYRESHREEAKEASRIYREENREEVLRKGREKYYKNIEKYKERSRQNYIKHRESRLEKQKIYAANHKDEIKEKQRRYNQTESGKLVIKRNTKKRKLKKTNTEIKEIVSLKDLYKKYDGECQLCHRKCNWEDKTEIYSESDNHYHVIVGTSYPTQDHIIPITAGGEESWENSQLLCKRCNAIKGTATMEEAKERLYNYLKIRKNLTEEDKITFESLKIIYENKQKEE